MTDKVLEEFEVWFAKTYPLGNLERDTEEVLRKMIAGQAWQASRESPLLHPLQKTLRDNGDLIAAQATIAQQAQMIEHLRGGPTPLYTAVDMANAAADGFRDGAASLLPVLEMTRSYVGQEGSDAELAQLEAAISAIAGKEG
ncbi:hypothetical protein [Pseudomonas fluorescens]|uniref:hypothetical protein n=1 Tax=Pseudomonas fluorescens TaxID=294 RepID=UPI0005FB2126|nr:hypothetical protein [Pseudomonas fluorescens]KJZ41356.1 hypothetical protein VC33_00485 [Pseudomonas fluorescens]